MTMYCRNCGTKLVKGQAYCPNCGQPTKVPPSGGFFHRKKFIIPAIIVLAALAFLLAPSNWFAEPIPYTGIVIQALSNKKNTYLAYLELTDEDGTVSDQTAVIKTLVPCSDLMAGNCKESGTIHATGSIGGGDYPYYVQVSD